MKAAVVRAVLASIVLASAGCGGGGDIGANGYPDGGFGATPGGVKDMSYARELVEQGMIPPKEAFLVEAMFSEHDLPLTSEAPCTALFCTRAAMGIAPDESGDSHAWVQVGLSSTIDPDTFQRPPFDLVLVVDVSGSMGWDYPNGSNGNETTMPLLHAITEELGAEDRLAIAAFDDGAYDILDITPGDADAAIAGALGTIAETGGGGTNMMAGLVRGYEYAEAMGRANGRELRVVLITDAQPNIGSTGAPDFEGIVAEAAGAGISTTVIGIGLGLGKEVMDSMSAQRGANAFSVMDAEDVAELMADSFPWMFCPIAYDLTLAARVSDGLSVADGYGFPGEHADDEVTLSARTIFLSKRRGALLLELASDAEVITSAGVELTVDYTDLEGTLLHDELAASYTAQPLDEGGRWFAQAGVEKATALALLVTAMHEAALAYETDHAAAIEILQPARARFAADAAAAGDGAIDPEIAFTDAILALMQSDAQQGNFYPQ
jgi:Ca-activated chloride channel family protein